MQYTDKLTFGLDEIKCQNVLLVHVCRPDVWSSISHKTNSLSGVSTNILTLLFFSLTQNFIFSKQVPCSTLNFLFTNRLRVFYTCIKAALKTACYSSRKQNPSNRKSSSYPGGGKWARMQHTAHDGKGTHISLPRMPQHHLIS